jgi:hypothetical protein
VRPLALIAVVLASVCWGGGVAHAADPAVPSTHRLATLLGAHWAFAEPRPGAARLVLVRGHRPLTGGRTVLPVLGRRTGSDGRPWLRVRLPGRPNGWVGWIRAHSTRASSTGWHIVVDPSRRRTTVYEGGRLVRRRMSIVGKSTTPTPDGDFFVEELIQLRAGQPGGPFALALSARSTVLQEFDGGPGQIALHGRANIGGTFGRATSHGCVRLDAATLRWLVLRIRPGTPVTITGG